MKTALNKLRRTAGESIAETLVAMLIVALAALMLAGSLVSSAYVNNRVKALSMFTDTGEDTPGSRIFSDLAGNSKGSIRIKISVTGSTDAPAQVDAALYTDSGGNYYYE